jgi:hypothetical protein
MSLLAAYTNLHVAISLVGIVAGFVAMSFMWTRRESNAVTAIFLSMTILTSVTGFGFPASEVKPAHILGVISLVALGVAVHAKYVKHSIGSWMIVYLSGAILAQYLNVFVLIVQSFQKLSFLRALNPTQPSFLIQLTQVIMLLGFLSFTAKLIFVLRRAGSTQLNVASTSNKSC